MDKLTIKNGKFYRGNEEVRPVCGDAEQIACLKKYDRVREQATGDGLEVEMEVDICYELHFTCVCGSRLRFFGSEYDVSGYDCIEDVVVDDVAVCKQKTTCNNCGLKYKAKVDNEGNIVAVLKE